MSDDSVFRLDGKVAVITGGSSVSVWNAPGFSPHRAAVVLADIDEPGGRAAKATWQAIPFREVRRD